MSNLKNVKLGVEPITSTYAGEFAGEYIAAALLSASTIDNGGVTVKGNIAFKEVIKKLVSDDLVTAAGCDFVDDSSFTLTERIIEPRELQVNIQLCKKDFIGDWESQQMGFGLGQSLPPKFSDFLIAHVASKVAQNTEFCIWQGDTAAASKNSFDGFEKLLAADADVIDVAGVAIDAGNVVVELGKVVNAIPDTVYGKEDLFIYVSTAIAKSYVEALGGFGANGLGANGVNNQGTQWWNNGSLSVNGVKLFVAQGLSADTMVAAQKSNLYFGTGLLNNTNEVKVLDMADLDGSNNARMIMRFTSAVQFGIGEEIVLYSVA